jgi:hypothetical protein
VSSKRAYRVTVNGDDNSSFNVMLSTAEMIEHFRLALLRLSVAF